MVRQQQGLVRDPVLDTAFQDLESLRDNLTQAQEKMFEVGVYVSIYGDTETDLLRAENEMRSILESK